jgi:glycosyltransferase involved in cell wall biosynthesis
VSGQKPKKLVIFSKTFLPEFNPESIRTAAFIKYMMRDGWEIFLFTYSPGEITDKKYDFLKSVSITRIPEIRVAVPGLGYGVNYFGQLARTLKSISATVRKHQVPFMFVSVPQLQPLIVGALTKMRFPAMRLVQEFRDTYSISELTSRSAFKSRILQKLERSMMKYGDAFIFVTRIIKDEYVKHFGKEIPKIAEGHVVLNGFDPEDYPENPAITPGSDKITISYTGNLYGSRNLDLFLQGLGEALQKKLAFKNLVEVVVAGDVSAENLDILKRIIAEFDLSENVKFLGKKSHSECVGIQCAATYNILVTHKKGSFYAIPSKIFEYAAAKRPIIAVTADPLAVEIIEEHKLGVCFPHDEKAIAEGFLKLLDGVSEQKAEVKIPAEFRRDNQIKRIAEIIQSN